jgi:hypothetical protein
MLFVLLLRSVYRVSGVVIHILTFENRLRRKYMYCLRTGIQGTTTLGALSRVLRCSIVRVDRLHPSPAVFSSTCRPLSRASAISTSINADGQRVLTLHKLGAEEKIMWTASHDPRKTDEESPVQTTFLLPVGMDRVLSGSGTSIPLRNSLNRSYKPDRRRLSPLIQSSVSTPSPVFCRGGRSTRGCARRRLNCLSLGCAERQNGGEGHRGRSGRW